jgi:hypothetical protein
MTYETKLAQADAFRHVAERINIATDTFVPIRPSAARRLTLKKREALRVTQHERA